MIMEYVEGQSLAERLKRGAIPIADAINYIEQGLVALSYAHAQHVVHRDIKPANMMLTAEGVVKLMDFGIARQRDDQTLTVAGTTTGSLSYMSPEQVNGEKTDARSDLYSMGISLYELVTGQRPFRADSDFAVMVAHLKEMPRPPIELKPELGRALNEIILTSIAKDPAARFQSADDFRAALLALHAGPTTVGLGAPVGGAAAFSSGAAARRFAADQAPTHRRSANRTFGSNDRRTFGGNDGGARGCGNSSGAAAPVHAAASGQDRPPGGVCRAWWRPGDCRARRCWTLHRARRRRTRQGDRGAARHDAGRAGNAPGGHAGALAIDCGRAGAATGRCADAPSATTEAAVPPAGVPATGASTPGNALTSGASTGMKAATGIGRGEEDEHRTPGHERCRRIARRRQ